MSSQSGDMYGEAFATMRIAQIHLKRSGLSRAIASFREFESYLGRVRKNHEFMAWKHFVMGFREHLNNGMNDYILALAKQGKWEDSLFAEERRRHFYDLSDWGNCTAETREEDREMTPTTEEYKDCNHAMLIVLRVCKDHLIKWVLCGPNRKIVYSNTRRLRNGELERVATWISMASFAKWGLWQEYKQLKHHREGFPEFRAGDQEWNVLRRVEKDIDSTEIHSREPWEVKFNALYIPERLKVGLQLTEKIRQSATDFYRIIRCPEPGQGQETREGEEIDPHSILKAFIEEAETALRELSNMILSGRVRQKVEEYIRNSPGTAGDRLVRANHLAIDVDHASGH